MRSSSLSISTLLATLLVSLALASTVHADRVCRNTLDDSFFNKCRIDNPPGYLTQQSQLVQSWINPRFLAQVPVCLILLLPILFKRDSDENNTRYAQIMLTLLNFIHRIGYALVLDVALYAVFRQHRPCECSTDGGPFVQVGSIYGMPSGDAMSGAIFASLFLDVAPIFPVGSRILGLVIIVLVNMERMALGFHTMGQTTVGALLGILLHFYNTRAPQFMTFVDNIVQIVLGYIVLAMDPALSFPPNDVMNLFSWMTWGVAFMLFETILMIHFHMYNSLPMWDSLRLSFVTIVGQGRGDDPEINGQQLKMYKSFNSDLLDTDDEQKRIRIDTAVILVAFVILVIGNLISQYVMVWGWQHTPV